MAKQTKDDNGKADGLGDKLQKDDLKTHRAQGTGIFEKDPILSSGKFWLDYLSGDFDGLFPKASICELAALKGAGKTTLCLETIAYNQYLAELSGGAFRVLYLDFEKNLVRQQNLARRLGCDPADKHFYYRQPTTLEGGTQFMLECLKPHTRQRWLGIAEPLDFIVIDTIAAARPIIEIDNKIGGTTKPGYRAKLWAEVFRNTQADLLNGGPAVVAINHLQQKIEMVAPSYGGPKFDSPASEALKLYAAQRYFLTLQEKATIHKNVTDEFTYEEIQQIYGICVLLNCEKSKVGPPYRKGSYFIVPGHGICETTTMFHAAERKEGALYAANNSHFGVPDALGSETVVGKKILGKINFLDHLRSRDGIADRTQLADNLNDLWKAQMEKYNNMVERKKRLSSDAVEMSPQANNYDIEGEAEMVAAHLAKIEKAAQQL